MLSSIFSNRLRSELGRNSMKQQELAAAAGCTQSDISRYLSGRIPSGDKLVALARVLGCSAEALLTNPDSRVAEEPPQLVDWRQRALNAERNLADFRAALEGILGKF